MATARKPGASPAPDPWPTCCQPLGQEHPRGSDYLHRDHRYPPTPALLPFSRERRMTWPTWENSPLTLIIILLGPSPSPVRPRASPKKQYPEECFSNLSVKDQISLISKLLQMDTWIKYNKHTAGMSTYCKNFQVLIPAFRPYLVTE